MRPRPIVPLLLFLALVLAWLRAGRHERPADPAPTADGARAAEHGRLRALTGRTGLPRSRASTRSRPRRCAQAQGTPPPPTPEEALEAEARIEGLVLLPDGKPAALARVQFVEWDAGGWPNDQREDSTVTDDEGRFSIHPAPVGLLQLVAMHEDWAQSDALLLLAQGEHKREQRLVLRRQLHQASPRCARGSARGGRSRTVMDDQRSSSPPARTPATSRSRWCRRARTGRCCRRRAGLALLRRETLFLANMLERSCNSANVLVGEGQTVEVLLGGIPSGSVRLFGRVRAGDAAQAGVWLWAEGNEYDHGNMPRARTDERGEYEMLWLAAAQLHVIFHVDASRAT